MTEKTINEFLKEMAAEGFNFSFIATNGTDIYNGKCKDGVIEVKKQVTQEELKQRITEKLKQGGERKSIKSTPTNSQTLIEVM